MAVTIAVCFTTLELHCTNQHSYRLREMSYLMFSVIHCVIFYPNDEIASSLYIKETTKLVFLAPDDATMQRSYLLCQSNPWLFFMFVDLQSAFNQIGVLRWECACRTGLLQKSGPWRDHNNNARNSTLRLQCPFHEGGDRPLLHFYFCTLARQPGTHDCRWRQVTLHSWWKLKSPF